MTKTAAKGMRLIAEQRVAAYLRQIDPLLVGGANARDLVAIVFDTLREPDRDMAEAGRRELALAGSGGPPAYARHLAYVVWRAMFAEMR